MHAEPGGPANFPAVPSRAPRCQFSATVFSRLLPTGTCASTMAFGAIVLAQVPVGSKRENTVAEN